MYPIGETVYRYCFSSCTIRLLAKEKNVRRRGEDYFSISSLLVSYMKVLILSRTTCLSDTQLTNIRHFVAAGGGLVVMNQSLLCDEFGRPRSDLGLAELFQARYIDHEGHTTWWPHFDKMVLFTLCPHYVMDITLRVLVRILRSKDRSCAQSRLLTPLVSPLAPPGFEVID